MTDFSKLDNKQIRKLRINASNILKTNPNNNNAKRIFDDSEQELRRRGAKIEQPQRRPTQNFGEMGLKPGTKLTFVPKPEEIVVVVNDRELSWIGQHWSLSSLTTEFSKKFGTSESKNQWKVGERSLTEIYDETYGQKQSLLR